MTAKFLNSGTLHRRQETTGKLSIPGGFLFCLAATVRRSAQSTLHLANEGRKECEYQDCCCYSHGSQNVLYHKGKTMDQGLYLKGKFTALCSVRIG